MCQQFRIFSIFDTVVPTLNTFSRFPITRKYLGSGLKRVASGSDSNIYRTNYLQNFENSIEDVKHFYVVRLQKISEVFRGLEW